MNEKDQPKQETPPPVAPQPAQQTATTAQPASGMAIAAMVLGILAFLGGWAPFWGFGAGVAALILGIIALKKKLGGKGMAIAGIATGSVAIVWNVIVTIIFMMAVIFAGVGTSAAIKATNELSKVTTTYNSAQQAKIDAKKDFAKGQTAVFDIFDVKVNQVTRNFVPESSYAKASDGKELIVVNVTVTNNSDESQYVSSYEFKINENGIANSSDIWATADPEFEGGTLAPGATTTGNIVYEVNKDANGLKIQYETYAYDSESAETKTLVYTLAI